jgi:spermidine synthase
MITLAKQSSAQGKIAIVKDRRTGAIIYRQGRCHQTEADTDGISISAYIHVLFGLLHQSKSRDVLLIGGGGGTLGTMLHAAATAVTMLDTDAAAFALARRYFKLPAGVTCHVADGRDFLADNPRRYDAIVLDAYIGAEIPPQFMTVDFFKLARSRLRKRTGCLFANAYVVSKRDRKADRLAALMRAAFPTVRLLDEVGSVDRNAIVMAGAVTGLEAPSLLMAPKCDVVDIEGTLERMAFRAWRARKSN